MYQRLASFLFVCAQACVPEAPSVTLSTSAQGVQVGPSDAPLGARLIGAIEATDGHGCGIDADRGTLPGATAKLKETAARRGIDYVRLTREVKPYSGHDCQHGEYTLSGLGYRIGGDQSKPGPVNASSALPTCQPDCAEGYVCAVGQCQPRCEPACGPELVCRIDRVCAAAAR